MQSGEPAEHCLNPEVDTATTDHACHRPILEALIPQMFFKDPARGYRRAFVVGPFPLPLTHRTPHAAPFVMDFIALRSIVHNLLLRGCLSLLTHLGSHPRRLCCYKAAALSQLPHPRNLPAAIKQQQLLAKHFTSVPPSFLYGGKTTSAIYIRRRRPPSRESDEDSDVVISRPKKKKAAYNDDTAQKEKNNDFVSYLTRNQTTTMQKW